MTLRTATGATVVGIAIAAAILLPNTQVPNYAPPPGALNLDVTQANIATTICVRGWTRTVRPPLEYTSALKRQQMAERHLPGRPSDYQEDHWYPLEIGGHPTDVRNLWPERLQEAIMKDALEYALNRAVCGGKMTLQQAQACLDHDWVSCAKRMRTPTS